MISDCTEAFQLPRQWIGMGDDSALNIGALRRMMIASAALDAALLSAQTPDPTKPYGRNVLLEGERLEIMLATWTPGIFCAPHDHGGSQGVVRVVQGRARHLIYKVASGRLEVVHEETAEAGELLTCGRDLVHAMGDDGGELPLVTLHMYTGPVPHMVVYDQGSGCTLKVDGGCGAWVPKAGSEQILSSRQGMVPVDEML